MSREEIEQLIAAMRANGVTRLEWERVRKGTRLCLTLPEGQMPPPVPQPSALPRLVVAAPGIGTFVPRGGDDGLPPLADAASVRAGDILGYIAQGPVLHLLLAPAQGRILGAWPEPGRAFGYGDRVAELEGEV